ncbi:hypothetical protein GGR52DRAFT_57594 [Hypoxylon sp. FL1284]|nr:hypothetical protein GGR52DRAFT_57594 [Hypoxylon sp. FL1284]
MATDSASCSPAPYGRACAGCSRAKCKCFYRADGSSCERCHRLGKACEPALAVRKRKARTPPPSSIATTSTQPASRLEEKLDDIVTLLRSQKQTQDQPRRHTRQPTRHGTSASSLPAPQNPDVMIDTTANVIHLVRPASPEASISPILEDVSVHDIPDTLAEEQLGIFRLAFISHFPLVHIPATTTAYELRRQRPFLWLLAMALSTRSTTQQFAMEETIWHIISRKIVTEHLMNLDLLLGVVCFSAWYHYFKQEKPFMCMLTQLAVSLAFDLGIHQDAAANPPRRSRVLAPSPHRPRTMEERRTIIAVFRLTSSTWSAYRKIEPLRWTPYMDECLRILSEGKETQGDIVLAAQVKCQIITYQLTRPPTNYPAGGESLKAPSTILTDALLRQLNDIRQSLPADLRSHRAAQFYLDYTEIKIRESQSLLAQPLAADDAAGLSNLQRLQELDAALTAVERWLGLLFEWPARECVGADAEMFAQFSQCLVVLFKLGTLEQLPGWDLAEVRQRADVFAVLDRFSAFVAVLPGKLGIVDADGPRRGLLFKVNLLVRAIKALFLAEMPGHAQQGPTAAADSFPTPISGSGEGSETADLPEFMMEPYLMDDVLLNMMYDDIQLPAWDFSVG